MLRCHVRGPVGPLLTALASAGVTELLSREPSLEELFLAQYGDHGPRRDQTAPTAATMTQRAPSPARPTSVTAVPDRAPSSRG